jgi:hypothetical protein
MGFNGFYYNIVLIFHMFEFNQALVKSFKELYVIKEIRRTGWEEASRSENEPILNKVRSGRESNPRLSA